MLKAESKTVGNGASHSRAIAANRTGTADVRLKRARFEAN